VPAAQSKQDDTPVLAENVPWGHSALAVKPKLGHTDPVAHVLHEALEMLPTWTLKVPGLHNKHADCPVELAYRPIGQMVVAVAASPQ
jgi:hypothetical protein